MPIIGLSVRYVACREMVVPRGTDNAMRDSRDTDGYSKYNSVKLALRLPCPSSFPSSVSSTLLANIRTYIHNQG